MEQGLFETSNQFWVLLCTIYGGVVLGVLYDSLFIMRKTLGGRKILTALFDIVFWVLATVFAFVLLYVAVDGALRFYEILGFSFGAILYFLGPGKAVRWLYRKICQGVRIVWERFKDTGIYRLLSK